MNSEQLRQHLDQKAQQLSAQSSDRLLEARRAALSAPRTRFTQRLWLGPALASVLFAAVVAWVQPWQNNASAPAEPIATETTIHADDYEILASEDSLELIDDLEFLIWLSEQELDNG